MNKLRILAATLLIAAVVAGCGPEEDCGCDGPPIESTVPATDA